VPQLWYTWANEYTIREIVLLQDYKLAKGMTTYPVTLLLYPNMRDPDSYTVTSEIGFPPQLWYQKEPTLKQQWAMLMSRMDCQKDIRTIFERVLAVLSDTKLPKRLWMEILQTVVYVKNRSPVRPLGSKTPYEVLYGKKPDLSNLRIPGCIVYAIIPKEKRGKSDFHVSRARYLRPEASNQHRLYEEDSGKVIFARDVVFDEDAEIDAVHKVVEQESSARSHGPMRLVWPNLTNFLRVIPYVSIRVQETKKLQSPVPQGERQELIQMIARSHWPLQRE
jgi:hypothetical protein